MDEPDYTFKAVNGDRRHLYARNCEAVYECTGSILDPLAEVSYDEILIRLRGGGWVLASRGVPLHVLADPFNFDPKRWETYSRLDDPAAARWLADHGYDVPPELHSDAYGPSLVAGDDAKCLPAACPSPTETRGACSIAVQGPAAPILFLGSPVGRVSNDDQYNVLATLHRVYEAWRVDDPCLGHKAKSRMLSGNSFTVESGVTRCDDAVRRLLASMPILKGGVRTPGSKSEAKARGNVWTPGYWLKSVDEVSLPTHS